MRNPFCGEEGGHHLKSKGCLCLARGEDRPNAAQGHRETRLGILTHPSHMQCVSASPLLCALSQVVCWDAGVCQTLSHQDTGNYSTV